MKKQILLLSLGFFSISSFSADHQMGLSVGLGNANYTPSSNDMDGLTNISISYGREVSEWLTAKLGVHFGEDNNWVHSEEHDSLTGEDVEYEAFTVSANFSYPVSKHFGVHSDLGVNYHDANVSIDNVKQISETGAGYYLGFGGYYQFSGGLSLNLGWQSMAFGKIDITSTNLGLGYQF